MNQQKSYLELSLFEHLRFLALEYSRKSKPNLPDRFRTIHKYHDRDTGGLTRSVLDFLKFSGHFAERINTQGNFRKTKTGYRWTFSGVTKGSADIHALIDGKAVYIELKRGTDKQSPAQREFEKRVTTSGAIYRVIRSFDEFFEFYSQTFKPVKVCCTC